MLFELDCPNCIVWSTQAAAQKYDYKKMVWMRVFSCDIIRTPIITWLRSAMALFSASAPMHSFYVQVILQPYAAFWNEDRLEFVTLQISIYYSTLPFSCRIASCSCSFKPLYFFLPRRVFRPSLAPSSTTIRNSCRGLCTNYYDCAAWCICTASGGRQRRPCRFGLLLALSASCALANCPLKMNSAETWSDINLSSNWTMSGQISSISSACSLRNLFPLKMRACFVLCN